MKFLILFLVCIKSSYAMLPLSIGLGALTQNIGITSGQNTGKKGALNVLQPTLELSTKYYFINPSLTYTWLGRNLKDGAGTVKILILSLPYYYLLTERFDFKLGPGFLLEWISGDGGLALLNNGTQTGVAFTLPGRSTSTLNFLLTFGVTYHFQPKWSAALDTQIVSLFSSRKSFGLSFVTKFHLF